MLISINARYLVKLVGTLILAGSYSVLAGTPTVSDPFDPSNPFVDSIVKESLHVNLDLVASGLVHPIGVVDANDSSGRLFIYDQTGRISILQNSVLSAEPFLDLSSRLVTLSPNYDERGLLGLAFSPNFANASSSDFGKFYTLSSVPVSGSADFTVAMPSGTPFNHQNVLTEWRVDENHPNSVDVSSERELMRIDWPQMNHDSGQLAFGPDGYLYVGMGDGGNRNDIGPGHGTTGNAQDLSTILGSIIRIDPNGNNSANGQYGIPSDNPFVNTPNALGEIFAYGFRNPWRFSFDMQTGALIEGDTGQGSIEEINLVSAGGNYGWNLKEGQFAFDPDTGLVSDDLSGIPAGLIDPVLQYDHSEGTALVGGFVYRGSEIPALQGKYIFGDWGTFGGPTGRLFAGDIASGHIQELNIDNMLNGNISLWLLGFGEDADGELYVLGSSRLGPAGTTGQVFKLSAPVPLPSAMWLLATGLAMIWRRPKKLQG